MNNIRHNKMPQASNDASASKKGNQMEKSLGRRQTGIKTELLSNMITNHSKLVGALGYNERVEVRQVDVEGDTSTVHVEMYEEVPN